MPRNNTKPATNNTKKRKLEKQPENQKIYDKDSSEKIQKLLEPFTKDQLIEFLCDASLIDSTLLEKIHSIADQDISHRKIFVHGIGWDTTQETFRKTFEPFGEIEDCRLVVDKISGRAKGYGFVLFKSRANAVMALKEPQKKINNRFVACQLASIGPGGAPQQSVDSTGRKVYVSNVSEDIDAEKLKVMFAKFGEIEMGPMGFDVHTGKSRGFALFLYKTVEGAKSALEEPYKMFEGHQLHCQLASKSSNHLQQHKQQSTLAAAAAAQNLAMFAQHPSLNPLYNGFLMNQNPGFMAGNVNPMFAGGFHPSQIGGSSVENSIGLGGYGSPYMGLLGAGGRSSLNPLQGMQPYESSQQQFLGQSSSSSRTQPLGGSFPGYPTYM